MKDKQLKLDLEEMRAESEALHKELEERVFSDPESKAEYDRFSAELEREAKKR